MSWVSKAVGSITGSNKVRKASKKAAKQLWATAQGESGKILEAGEQATGLGRERFGMAQGLMDPYIQSAEGALGQLNIEAGLAPGEAGTAYMQTPGYQNLMSERQAGAEQAAAGAGSLYSGRRIGAAADVSGQTQSQFYNNYMNLLTGMASPNAATNMANMGLTQGQNMSNQMINTQLSSSDLLMRGRGGQGAYNLAGAQATQAGRADLLGGLMKAGTAFI